MKNKMLDLCKLYQRSIPDKMDNAKHVLNDQHNTHKPEPQGHPI